MQVVESLSFPTKDASWPTKVAIGGLLSCMTVVLFLGTILTGGYSLRVIRNAAEGVDKLPEWDNWGEMLWQGLLLFLASLVAFIIPIGLVGFGFGSMIVGLFSAGANESAAHLLAGAGIGVVLGGVGLLLMLVMAFFFPMMSLRVAIHRSFGTAFDIGAVLRDIGRVATEYIVMIAVLWLCSAAIGVVISFISFIPILPQLLAAAAGFYLLLVCSHTLGTLYRTRLAQDVSLQ